MIIIEIVSKARDKSSGGNMGSERFIVLRRQNLKFGNCFAGFVKAKSACRTCSMIICPRSTNHVIVFCRCRCRRRSLTRELKI